MIFSEKVRTARKTLGLSQKALADVSGIALRTIQNYESGVCIPKSADTYGMLADALHVTPDCLSDDLSEIVFVADDGGEAARFRIKKLASEICSLMMSGNILQKELDEIMLEINSAYWRNKKRGGF